MVIAACKCNPIHVLLLYYFFPFVSFLPVPSESDTPTLPYSDPISKNHIHSPRLPESDLHANTESSHTGPTNLGLPLPFPLLPTMLATASVDFLTRAKMQLLNVSAHHRVLGNCSATPPKQRAKQKPACAKRCRLLMPNSLAAARLVNEMFSFSFFLMRT